MMEEHHIDLVNASRSCSQLSSGMQLGTTYMDSGRYHRQIPGYLTCLMLPFSFSARIALDTILSFFASPSKTLRR